MPKAINLGEKIIEEKFSDEEKKSYVIKSPANSEGNPYGHLYLPPTRIYYK